LINGGKKKTLPTLPCLNLGGNQLMQLPIDIGLLKNLRALDLRENQLMPLPPEIGQLSNLRHLIFSSNQLTPLSPETVCLLHLQRLKLNENQPMKVGNRQDLQKLFLENQLAPLPNEIFQLKGLTITILSNQHPLSSLGALHNVRPVSIRLDEWNN
jgi:Leucine-rich repeat (LRR) protein